MSLAPVLTAVQGIVFINGETCIGILVYLLKSPLHDVEGIVESSASLAVRTVNHSGIVRAAGAVVTAVSCTYRAAHTRTSFLTDQSTHATSPQKTERAAENKSASMIDMMRQQSAHMANNPAQRVRKMLAPMPMTLRKVLDTFDSILLKNL